MRIWFILSDLQRTFLFFGFRVVIVTDNSKIRFGAVFDLGFGHWVNQMLKDGFS